MKSIIFSDKKLKILYTEKDEANICIHSSIVESLKQKEM